MLQFWPCLSLKAGTDAGKDMYSSALLQDVPGRHSNYNAPPSNPTPVSLVRVLLATFCIHRSVAETMLSKVATRILVPPSTRTATGGSVLQTAKEWSEICTQTFFFFRLFSILSCRALAGALRKKPPASTTHAFKQRPCFMRPALQLARSRVRVVLRRKVFPCLLRC